MTSGGTPSMVAPPPTFSMRSTWIAMLHERENRGSVHMLSIRDLCTSHALFSPSFFRARICGWGSRSPNMNLPSLT
eukprot:scaffold99889_cov29-Tisochrysis_lutea.AAC.5